MKSARDTTDSAVMAGCWLLVERQATGRRTGLERMLVSQLAVDDVERIGMNIRDWIRQVGG